MVLMMMMITIMSIVIIIIIIIITSKSSIFLRHRQRVFTCSCIGSVSETNKKQEWHSFSLQLFGKFSAFKCEGNII